MQLSGHLKDQLLRASSSIALNLAEGSGRFGIKDQKRFFHIAFGSLRECQAILDLEFNENPEVRECADKTSGTYLQVNTGVMPVLEKSLVCELLSDSGLPVAESRSYFFFPYFWRNFSTLPAVSTRRCSPVKNGCE